MAAPNLFLIYVSDVERSTAFYMDLFDMQPLSRAPRYVPFEVAPGVLFALWGGNPQAAQSGAVRTSEVGYMIPGQGPAVDALYEQWTARGVTVVEAPNDQPFGRTFIVADPDGNLIRVSPLD